MGNLWDYLKLSRPEQWYKNLVIFIALVFSGLLFDFSALYITIAGFIALCLVSAANYAINDIFDCKADSRHPEKRLRPVACRRINISSAGLFALFLMATGLSLSFWVSSYAGSLMFFALASALFAITLLYSLWLKHELFLDSILIGINFVIRAVAGAVILNVELSPWLIICTFFAALLLAFSKRKAEIIFLSGNPARHRKVLGRYSRPMLDSLSMMSASLLILSFALYSFLKQPAYFLFTLPFILYLIFRYMYHVDLGDDIGRRPNLIFKDTRMLFTSLVLGVMIMVMLYA